MKKIISLLLALAMVSALLLPAAAVEPAITVELPDEVAISTWFRSAHVDEETQVEWDYYYLDHTSFDATINGEFMEGIYFAQLLDILYYEFSSVYGDKINWEITDGQGPESQWQVGGTYPVTLCFFYYDEQINEEVTVWTDSISYTVYDNPVSIEISDSTTVSSTDCELSYDEETQKEFTYYRWYEHCRFDATVNGVEYLNISFDGLIGAFAEQYGESVHGGIGDTQHIQEWTVGNTYDCTLMLISDESFCNVWESNIQVTLVEPSVAIEVNSNLEIDELMGWLQEAEDGSTYRHYEFQEHGVMDVTVDGIDYPSVSANELRHILTEQYGPVHINFSYSFDTNEGDPMDQTPENPWQVGDSFLVEMSIRLEETGELLYKNDQTIRVCETKIASASIAPITYYAYQHSVDPEITVTYKDGTTKKSENFFYNYTGSWPEEPGSYTMDFTVLGQFQVSVPVTVLATPTSGKLGENITWSFDAATETLTISGTGATYYYDQQIASGSEELNLWIDDWNSLLLSLLPKHVVVEEGIEYLNEGMFYFGVSIESLSLPATLKQMPTILIGHNGPSADLDFGIAANGMTTLVVPENITSWLNTAFYYCWGITDIYLPAGLTEVNLDNLCYIAWTRQVSEFSALDMTIHFAGTEEQWNSINFIPGYDRNNIPGTELSEQELLDLLASFSVIFNDPADSYTKEAVTVPVPDSAVEITEGKDVVIDVTNNTEEPVGGVAIAPETVEKISSAEAPVEIKLSDATVSFDSNAIDSIVEQAGDNTVTIVAKEVKEYTLTTEQKSALEEKEVCVILTLEAYAGEDKITEFGDGKVTISVPFELPEGKDGSDFYVAYISDDGKITEMPTTYKDGALTFHTTHFSSYAVLEKQAPTDNNGNSATGDSTPVLLFVVLMCFSAVCLPLCFTKRRLIKDVTKR